MLPIWKLIWRKEIVDRIQRILHRQPSEASLFAVKDRSKAFSPSLWKILKLKVESVENTRRLLKGERILNLKRNRYADGFR
jgi:hypothetical protein